MRSGPLLKAELGYCRARLRTMAKPRKFTGQSGSFTILYRVQGVGSRS